MKLKFTKTVLHEADQNYGHRVNFCKELDAIAEKVITDSGYVFKADADPSKGFYIMPKFGHLIGFTLELQDGKLALKVSKASEDMKAAKEIAKDLPIIGLEGAEFDAQMEVIAKNVADAAKSFLILNGNINESLDEGASLLEFANPFTALANKLKSSIAGHKAKKQDNNDQEARLTKLADAIVNTLSQIDANLKITKKVSNTSATVRIESKYILAVSFDHNMTKDVYVSNIQTADGKKSAEAPYSKDKNSIAQLFKTLKGKLELKSINNILKYLGAEEEADTTEPASDSADASGYRLPEIAAALPADSELRDSLTALLGESADDENDDSDNLLLEARLTMKGVKSANYMQVYEQIKNNTDAVNALVDRFMHKAFSMSPDRIAAVKSTEPSASMFPEYVTMLTNNGFVISSEKSPTCFLLSRYLQKWQQWMGRVAHAIVTLYDKRSDVRAVLKDDVLKSPSGQNFASLDSAFKGSQSILYCRELNKPSESEIAGILTQWYLYRNNKVFDTLVNSDSSTTAQVAEILGVTPKQVKDRASLLKAVFCKSEAFRKVAEIKAIIEKINSIKVDSADSADDAAETASNSEQQLQSDTPARLPQELKDQIERDGAVKIDAFMSDLQRMVTSQHLDDDALKTLQLQLLNQIPA